MAMNSLKEFHKPNDPQLIRNQLVRVVQALPKHKLPQSQVRPGGLFTFCLFLLVFMSRYAKVFGYFLRGKESGYHWLGYSTHFIQSINRSAQQNFLCHYKMS
jgi:hypothetical protein